MSFAVFKFIFLISLPPPPLFGHTSPFKLKVTINTTSFEHTTKSCIRGFFALVIYAP